MDSLDTGFYTLLLLLRGLRMELGYIKCLVNDFGYRLDLCAQLLLYLVEGEPG